jgi:hypothetical protein
MSKAVKIKIYKMIVKPTVVFWSETVAMAMSEYGRGYMDW